MSDTRKDSQGLRDYDAKLWEEELEEERRKNQGPSMRDTREFVPGRDDELFPCPCGKRQTMGGRPCSLCRVK